MNVKDLQKLRKKLPPKFAKTIAEMVNEKRTISELYPTKVNAYQVSKVLRGVIKDPVIVADVVEQAIELVARQKKQSQRLSKVLAA